MKIKILRPYLDFEVGKTYTAGSTELGNYMVAMRIGKEVVSKGSKLVVEPVSNVPVEPVSNVPVEPVATIVLTNEDLDLF